MQRTLTTVDQIESSSMKAFDVVDSVGTKHRVLVIRVDDTFYGLGDICSHADVSLGEGTLWSEECEVECPKHGSMFSVSSGEPQTLPATQPVPVYEIIVVNDEIQVVLP